MKLGYKHTEAQKEKIKQALTGIKRSPETIERCKKAQSNRGVEWCARISLGKLGERNPFFGKRGAETPNWKGGLTSDNQLVRNSVPFQRWRKSIFERDDYTCQDCKVRGGELHAHHIKSFRNFPELRIEMSNGITLCVECHKKTNNFSGRVLYEVYA